MVKLSMCKPMKIAVFTDAFPPQINGVVTHILDANRLLSLKGYEIIIFAPKPEKDIDNLPLPANVKVHYLSSIPLFFYEDFYLTPPFSPYAFKIVQQFAPEIIHFHSPITVGANGIAIAKLLKIPLIGSFHAYFMEPEYLRIVKLDKIKLDKSKVVNKLLWYYANLFYNQADVVISPSFKTKDDLINHGVNRPIKVISNGVDCSFNKKGSSKMNFNLPKKYILYVGRVSREKSIDVLINAFSEFAKNEKETHLVIIGDGPAKKELEKLSFSLNLSNRIHFIGLLHHDDLINSPIYKNALVFATASKSETQCISVLEAINFGLPIIGVKSRAIPELIKGNGILCEADNIKNLSEAFSLLTKDVKLRKRCQYQSLELAKKHSINLTIQKLESLYASLVKN